MFNRFDDASRSSFRLLPDGQPPSGAASEDTIMFLFRLPEADAGLVQAFMGRAGTIVRTTPFHLASANFSDDRQFIHVFLNMQLTDNDITLLERQLKHVNEDVMQADLSALKLKVITPARVDVIIYRNAKVVGSASDPGVDEVPDLVQPLVIDVDAPYHFIVQLTEAAPQNAQLNDYQFVIMATYLAKVASEEYSSLGIAVQDGMKAIENVVGGKVRRDDFISRDVAQSITTNTKVRRSLTAINSRNADVDILLNNLKSALTSEVTKSETQLKTLESIAIWTPDLGRLEIQTRAKQFEDMETSLETSVEETVKKHLKQLQEEAREEGGFNKWYDLQYEKEKRNENYGWDSAVNVFEIVKVSDDKKYEVSFDKERTKLDAGEKAFYEKVHSKMQEERDFEKYAKSYAKQNWKGHNNVIDHEAKAFNLAIVKDLSTATSEFTTIARFNTSGRVEKIPMRSNRRDFTFSINKVEVDASKFVSFVAEESKPQSAVDYFQGQIHPKWQPILFNPNGAAPLRLEVYSAVGRKKVIEANWYWWTGDIKGWRIDGRLEISEDGKHVFLKATRWFENGISAGTYLIFNIRIVTQE